MSPLLLVVSDTTNKFIFRCFSRCRRGRINQLLHLQLKQFNYGSTFTTYHMRWAGTMPSYTCSISASITLNALAPQSRLLYCLFLGPSDFLLPFVYFLSFGINSKSGSCLSPIIFIIYISDLYKLNRIISMDYTNRSQPYVCFSINTGSAIFGEYVYVVWR